MAGKNTHKASKSTLRRESILACALTLFDRNGYANTSMEDIAKAVGIRREALYYYYRNRAEILLAIIQPQAVALLEGVKAINASDAAPVTKLREAVRNHLERFDRHCLEMTVSLRDGVFEGDEAVHAQMGRIWKTYERLWVRLIAEGQRQGDFSSGGDPKMIAFGILGMCNWMARWYDPHGPVSVDQLIDTYFNLLAFGLAKRGL
jgi:TetR/AcrR family transcriptional regulator, cholesterol catabolism regulator